jgi:thioredoxin 1
MFYSSEVNDSNFNSFVGTAKIIIIDMYSSWCAPCKILSPIIGDLAAEYTGEGFDIKVGKMDIDSNREIVTKMEIISIPTVLIYKDGKLVEKITGMIQKIKLKETIEKHAKEVNFAV